MKDSPHPDLLFLTCGFPPEQVGGVEQHTLELGRELRALGIDVAYYTRGDRPDLKECDTYLGEFDGFPVNRVVYRWSRARSLRHIYDDEQLAGACGRILERYHPWIVHVHHLSGLGSSCLKVIKEAGIPLVMTLHDYWAICPRGQMFSAELTPCSAVNPEQCTPCIAGTWTGLVPSGGGLPFDPSLPKEDRDSVAALQDWNREMLTIPDRLLTPSAAARDRFLDFGIPADRIQVVENGLNTEPFRNLERKSADQVRFGFVGTLLPSKGAHTLVEAFSRLPAGTASLLIAGNAPPFHQCTDYMERIEKKVAESREKNPIEILGTYDHQDLPELLQRIDVLVVPPLWHEVYGLTLREGMLAGCAVITSRVGGLPQAIDEGRNGFTYTPGDVNELSGQMLNFIQDRSLAARIGSSSRTIRTISNLAQDLLGIYEELGVRLP